MFRQNLPKIHGKQFIIAVYIALAYIRKSGETFHHHHHTLFASPIPTDTPNCIPHEKKVPRNTFYQLQTSIFSFLLLLKHSHGTREHFLCVFIYVKWKINSTLPSSPSNRTKRILLWNISTQRSFSLYFYSTSRFILILRRYILVEWLFSLALLTNTLCTCMCLPFHPHFFLLSINNFFLGSSSHMKGSVYHIINIFPALS